MVDNLLASNVKRIKEERLSNGRYRCGNCLISFTRKGLDTHDRTSCREKVARISKEDGYYTCLTGCDKFKLKLAFLQHLLSDHAE